MSAAPPCIAPPTSSGPLTSAPRATSGPPATSAPPVRASPTVAEPCAPPRRRAQPRAPRRASRCRSGHELRPSATLQPEQTSGDERPSSPSSAHGRRAMRAATSTSVDARWSCSTVELLGSTALELFFRSWSSAKHAIILYRGSESGVVIAVMVGLIEECKLILDALREDTSDADDIFDETAKMRRGIAKVLTKLDQELCQAVNAGTVTSATKKLIGDDEKGNMKPGKSLHNVVEDSGHALKNNETGSEAVAFSPPLSVDEPRTHGWDNEDVQTQGMEKHSSHQHVQCDRHKKKSSHQRLENSGRQCLGTELQHDHSKTINLSGYDEDEQENGDDTSSSSGATEQSRGRSKRRNDAKPVPRIEETMSVMSFKREPAAIKAQNRCQGQEFSMTSCLAVLNDMVDLSDDVKIQASEVFKDPMSREIFLGYETRLRALWLTKEVNKLGTLSNASLQMQV